jgi:hypothetical protein
MRILRGCFDDYLRRHSDEVVTWGKLSVPYGTVTYQVGDLRKYVISSRLDDNNFHQSIIGTAIWFV